jgi:hypothetical protein
LHTSHIADYLAHHLACGIDTTGFATEEARIPRKYVYRCGIYRGPNHRSAPGTSHRNAIIVDGICHSGIGTGIEFVIEVVRNGQG